MANTGVSDVLLDNQSSVHIFKSKHLLSSLVNSDTSLHLGGIVKGHVLKTSRVGSFLDVADHCVWYSPESVANILSFHQLEVDGHSPCYDRMKKVFIVRSPCYGTLEFPWSEKAEHYVCDFDKHQSKRRALKTMVCQALATVADNESQYPKRLVKAARRASELIAMPAIRIHASVVITWPRRVLGNR